MRSRPGARPRFDNASERRVEHIAPWLALAALIGAAGVHAAYLVLPGLSERFDTDDPFVYFQIARNLAQQGRLTFDGIHLTNGVQPLWTLILASIAWLLPDRIVEDSWQLMLVFQLVASAMSLLAGYLLFKLGSSMSGPIAGLLALFTWTLSPYIFRRDLLGLESALYAALLVLTILVYRRWDERPTPARSVGLGVLLGLTVLARLNAVFLAPILGLWAVWPRAGRWRVGPTILIAGATALTVAPYFVFNLITFGHFIQVAAATKAFEEAQFIAERFGDRWSVAFAEYTVATLVATASRLLLLIAKAYLALGGMGAYIVAFRWRMAPGPWSVLEGIWILMAVGGLALLAFSLWKSRARFVAGSPPSVAGSDFRGLGMLAAFVVVDLVISTILYPSYVPISGYWWWFANVLVLGVLGLACLVSLFRDRLAPASLPPALAGILILALANAGLWTGYRIFVSLEPTPKSHLMANYETVEWLNRHAPPDTVVAVRNCGVTGFFYKGRLIDFIGVANDFEYLELRKQGRGAEYMVAQNVTHILERGDYGGFAAPIGRALHETPYALPQPGVVGVYEVDRKALIEQVAEQR